MIGINSQQVIRMFNPFNSLESYNALRRAAGLDGSRSPSPDLPSYRLASPSPPSSPVRSPSPAPSSTSEEEATAHGYDGYRYEPMANLPHPASPPSWYGSYPSYGGPNEYASSYDASSSYSPSYPSFGYPSNPYADHWGHHYGNYPSYPQNVSYASSAGSHPAAGATLQLRVPDRASDTAGCAVAAIATVAATDYATARYHAVESGDFHPQSGMWPAGISSTLSAMGIDNTIKNAEEWSDIPDLAIVIACDRSLDLPEGIGHAVVLERNASGNFIYDSNKAAPVPLTSDYRLLATNYIEIKQ